MIRISFILTVVTLAIFAIFALTSQIAHADTLRPRGFTDQKISTWGPCEYEDSVRCVWDARRLGNGSGASFVAFPKGKHVFITHQHARRLLED